MSARQRGAAWVLAVILAGRIVDRLDLPFENGFQDDSAPASCDSLHAPSRDEPRPRTHSVSFAAPDSVASDARNDALPLAINEASARELQSLPRVGPVLAGRIVAWRQENGPFRSARDLERVPGIGARTAARLAPLVRFD